MYIIIYTFRISHETEYFCQTMLFSLAFIVYIKLQVAYIDSLGSRILLLQSRDSSVVAAWFGNTALITWIFIKFNEFAKKN